MTSALTPRLAVHSGYRVVAEKGGEDHRVHSPLSSWPWGRGVSGRKSLRQDLRRDEGLDLFPLKLEASEPDPKIPWWFRALLSGGN